MPEPSAERRPRYRWASRGRGRSSSRTLWTRKPAMQRPPWLERGNWLWGPAGVEFQGPLHAGLYLTAMGAERRSLTRAECVRRFGRDLEPGELRRLP